MERFKSRLIAITLAISQVLMPISYVVSQVGSKSTWKGRYFAPNDTPLGTKIYFDLTAKKNLTMYNYNVKESWDGYSLTVISDLKKDIIINRTN